MRKRLRWKVRYSRSDFPGHIRVLFTTGAHMKQLHAETLVWKAYPRTLMRMWVSLR